MSRDDNPKCNHGHSAVIVTNQPGSYDRDRSHRSTWVCSREACVWDASAWVMRGTGEKPWWRIGVDGEWNDGKYELAPSTGQEGKSDE